MSLQTTRKCDLFVEEYFLKMRSTTDQLSSVGQVVTDDDLLMYILASFGVEYESLVINFMQRSDSPSLQEVQLAFQAYEQRLAQQSYGVLDPSVNVAYYGGGRGSIGRGFGLCSWWIFQIFQTNHMSVVWKDMASGLKVFQTL